MVVLYAWCVSQIQCSLFYSIPTAVRDNTQLVDVYHPSLWCSRNYLCCGSSQRSNSKSTNGCCSVTWSPSSLQHMGVNFSHLIHSSPQSASPKVSNGDADTAKIVDGQAVEPPSSPTGSHNPVIISGNPLFNYISINPIE